MRRFVLRRLVMGLCATGVSLISAQAMASSFQLFEQDGASVGNYHAGYAAEANDASIAWYNPAGIPRIQTQQIVAGGAAIMTSFKYNGTIALGLPGFPGAPQGTVSQGGAFGIVPFLHYVAPLTEKLGFGFSIDVPFGLETDYGRDTPLKYSATLSQVSVVDISPSLGLLVTDKASVGLGLDLQKMEAQLDQTGATLNFVTRLPNPATNTDSTNRATDTGYGMHAGVLYQFTPDTRVGLSYHSKVRHHLSGSSKFIGPLGNNGEGGFINSGRAIANLTLPPYTALSAYHKLSPKWALLGSVIYTQWNVLQNLELQNIAGINQFGDQATDIIAVLPQKYSNSWQFVAGANYFVTDAIILRGGLGYDQTPVPDAYRNVRLPDNDRYIVAFGGHYQATKTIGIDLGYNHLFVGQAKVNPPPQQTGASIVEVNGHVNGGADVFSGQITWDLI